MAKHSLDRARLLTHAVHRFFECGEYHGPEELFDDRYLSFVYRAQLLGPQGQVIIGFMESSMETFEPLLRAINDIALLMRFIPSGASSDWHPLAARVRGHLQIAGRRYPDPAAVDFAVGNLTGVFNEVVAELEARRTI